MHGLRTHNKVVPIHSVKFCPVTLRLMVFPFESMQEAPVTVGIFTPEMIRLFNHCSWQEHSKLLPFKVLKTKACKSSIINHGLFTFDLIPEGKLAPNH